MRTLIDFWRFRALTAGLIFGLTQRAEAQAPAFDQAVLNGDAQGANSFVSTDAMATDIQGNTFVAGTFEGTVRFGAATLTSAGDADVFVAKRNASGTWQWATSGGGIQRDMGTDVALDSQGQPYMTGYVASGPRNVTTTASFGTTTLTTAGWADVFVAKLDAATGAWLWARQAGSGGISAGGDGYASALASDGTGGFFVAGTFTGPSFSIGTNTLTTAGLFVAKINGATGTWGWAVGTEGASVADLATDAQGSAYLTGNFGTSVAFPPFQLNYTRGSYMAKLSAAGTWQWATGLIGAQGAGTQVGPGATSCLGLAADNRGHVYAVGSFDGRTATFGATQLYNNSGTYFTEAPGSFQRADAFVARLSATTGTWQWAQRAGGNDEEYLTAPVVRGNRIYASGGFGIAPVYSPSGSPPMPSSSTFGSTTLVSAGQMDVVVTALDTTGQWQWAVRAGGAFYDWAKNTAMDASNRVYVAGGFNGNSAQFGALSVANSSGGRGTAGFLARLAGGPLATAAALTAPFALHVYPNPTHGTITVAGLPPDQGLEVLDALGRVILRSQMPVKGALNVVLPPALPAGMYVVRAAGQSYRMLMD